MTPSFLLTSIKSAITKAKISTPDCVHSETKAVAVEGRKSTSSPRVSTSTDRVGSCEVSTAWEGGQSKEKKT